MNALGPPGPQGSLKDPPSEAMQDLHIYIWQQKIPGEAAINDSPLILRNPCGQAYRRARSFSQAEKP